MFEAEYLQECERAELLGLPKPDKEAFMAHQSAQAALARHIEEEADRLRARPETNEIRITIHEEPEIRQDPNDENKNEKKIIHIIKISSRIKSMVDKLQAKEQSKKQAKAEASNLETELVEGDNAETKIDPQAEAAKPEASTCAIPTTSTEEAQKEEDNQPSRWDAFMQLWKNFVYPKKASE